MFDFSRHMVPLLDRHFCIDGDFNVDDHEEPCERALKLSMLRTLSTASTASLISSVSSSFSTDFKGYTDCFFSQLVAHIHDDNGDNSAGYKVQIGQAGILNELPTIVSPIPASATRDDMAS
ncbi:hypothetical protein ACFPFV_12525 [Salinicoccus siamensis]|uniref:hypothetical protein n=1 Tax=Salinicoccus siamensis TaxID=381830 RepID=UPI00361D1C9C